MHLRKLSFYEFPDTIRTIDIVIGVFLSFLIKYGWNKRGQLLNILIKHFLYIPVVIFQCMTIWYFLYSDLALAYTLLFQATIIGILILDTDFLKRFRRLLRFV